MTGRQDLTVPLVVDVGLGDNGLEAHRGVLAVGKCKTGGNAGELRVGIIGCGHVLPEHTLAWSGAPGCRMAGFYDLDPQRAALASRGVPGSRAFSSYDEALADCDLLDLCSPPQAHHAQALQAIAAGRHLLIEKPVTMTVAEWDDIAARAEAAGVKVGAVHQLKFGSHFQRALAWVRAGRIGDVLGVTCTFHVDRSADAMLATSGSWVNDLPGARWFEVLPHLLYLMVPFTGLLTPGKVVVAAGPAAPPGAPALEALVSLTGERCLASIHFSARSRLDERSLVIHGARGKIEIAILKQVVTRTALAAIRGLRPVSWIGVPFIEAAVELAQFLPDRTRFLIHRGGPSRHTELVRGFVAHLRGLGPSPTPPEEIRCVVDCCAAFGREAEEELRRLTGQARPAPDPARAAVPWIR